MNDTKRPKPKQNRVKPLSSPHDVDQIRFLLRSKVRDLLLFDLAVETGLTASQLLQFKVRDLQGLRAGDGLPVSKGKSDRDEFSIIGPKSVETFQRYLEELKPFVEDFLFKSRKGDGPISISSASRMVGSWFMEAGLEGRSGFLSLRKTWELYRQPSGTEKPDSGASEPAYSANTIKTPTTQELVYKELEHAIVTARLKPGEKLVAEKLARQMGISRMPVREAIGRLEARNFLTVQPQKGTTVSELSETNLKEILDIRLMLEGTASRKGAIAATKDTVRHLEALNEQYISAQKENDAKRIISVNREFHFTIYNGADMPILISMIQNLWDQISPYHHLMFRQTVFHDPKTGHVYHQKMIDGMAANDPLKVSKWLKTDLVESTEFVIGVIRSMRNEKQADKLNSDG